MTIELKPELQTLIQRDLQRGSYGSVADYLELAIRLLHEQEEWLAENRPAIVAKIEEGYAAAQRGELIEADEVRAQMEEKKRAWLSEQRRA